MDFKVEWFDDEKTILVWRFPEGYEWDDLVAALDVNEQMVGEVDHPVDQIIDLTQNREGPPPHLLSKFPKLAEIGPRQGVPNMSVMVGTRGLASTLGRIFSKLYVRLEMVDTMDEALAIIREFRSAEGQ
jgi:hypothetical protein